MPKIFQSTNPNFWLGKPRTAQFTTPLTAGLRFGTQETQNQARSKGRVRLLGAQVTNAATGGAVGMGLLISDAMSAFGTWTSSSSTYADQTTTAQGSGADIVTVIPTTQNNGFVAGATIPFNIICFELTTAAGGSPVLDFAYWGYPTTGVTTVAGWQTVATNLIAPSTFSSAGEFLYVINAPGDLMVKTAVGDFTGAPGGYYWIRVRSTTPATTTAGTAAHIYTGVEVARETQLAQHAQMNLGGGTGGYSRTLDGVGLQAFFATANANNHLYVEYE